MVDNAVDHRGGDHLVTEDLTPPGEGQVRRQDQRGVLVARRDQLEEEVGRLLLEGDVAHFVDNEQRVAAQPCELVAQASLGVGLLQSHHPLDRRGEQDALALGRGADPETDCEVRLAGARRAEQHDVGTLGEVGARRQVREELP